MQNSREQQRKIRKPSEVKKQRNRGNNKIRRTRDLFKKTENIKGKFHAKMGITKDSNGKDVTEAE